MATVRRTLELDTETDARLCALADARGQEPSVIVSDALALLDSATDESDLEIEEDLRRLHEFERTGEGVPLEDVKMWVRSWGTANELPPPKPRKI
jgi:predicted transcriptional regulator